MADPGLSIVIPVYNEEPVLDLLFAQLDLVLPTLGETTELILVNDGSTDRSLEVLERHAAERSGVRVLDLSRNFGHQAAISAGMDAARGRAIIVMDADLQDPPEVIARLVARFREGYDVVSAVRVRREGEPFFKRLMTFVFYRFLRAIARVDIPLDVGDFRLVSRAVADQVRSCRERNRFVRGLVAWVGFRQCSVEYVRPGRQAGTTKYPLPKLVRLALDGLASFSELPLQMATVLGLAFAGLSFAYLLFVVGRLAVGHLPPPGWTSLAFIVLFLGGVQLVCLGVLGIYLGRIYDEVRARPQYIVRRVIESPASATPALVDRAFG